MIKTIFHFNRDLRLTDNPAFALACKDAAVLPVYIFEDGKDPLLKTGAAGRWWLHRSLEKLNESLHGNLHFYIGDTAQILDGLKEKHGASIYQNSARDCTLWDLKTILKPDQSPYKVFTPFYNKCLTLAPPSKPLAAPRNIVFFKDDAALPLKALKLLPEIPWFKTMETCWAPGETGAQKQLRAFMQTGLKNYKIGRDFPAQESVSRLSPHLHFGEISARQVWHSVQAAGHNSNSDAFLREVCWREFSYYLLNHFPDLPVKNFQKNFDRFPWKNDPKLLRAWQKGKTGIPWVDAGMRELWQTGFMHNRVRMAAASFLTKNLLIDWRLGAEWFWDCLVDADLANNSASWQWVAGSGADAAPYFRIFNPVLQAEKFDPAGEYVRRYVPELEKLPLKYLFSPWKAPQSVLEAAGVILGKTYPFPIVDLAESRTRALQAYAVR